MKLKLVFFNCKDIKIESYGLIAQDLEIINPDWIVKNLMDL